MLPSLGTAGSQFKELNLQNLGTTGPQLEELMVPHMLEPMPPHLGTTSFQLEELMVPTCWNQCLPILEQHVPSSKN